MRRNSFVASIALLLAFRLACAQRLEPNSNRIFVSPQKWERVAGAPRNEKLRYSYGSLAILYEEGVYAEVAAPLIRTNEKLPLGLDLNEGFRLRLGSWKRVENSNLIRIESREVFRDKIIRELKCETTPNGKLCTPLAEDPLPGPVTQRICRLEHPSPARIADRIVCEGFVVTHPGRSIDLADFPEIVRGLVGDEKKTSAGSK